MSENTYEIAAMTNLEWADVVRLQTAEDGNYCEDHEREGFIIPCVSNPGSYYVVDAFHGTIYLVQPQDVLMVIEHEHEYHGTLDNLLHMSFLDMAEFITTAELIDFGDDDDTIFDRRMEFTAYYLYFIQRVEPEPFLVYHYINHKGYGPGEPLENITV